MKINYKYVMLMNLSAFFMNIQMLFYTLTFDLFVSYSTLTFFVIIL